VLSVHLSGAITDHLKDQFVWDKIVGIHEFCSPSSQFGSLPHVGTQHVPRCDMRQLRFFSDTFGPGSLPALGGQEE